MRGISAFNSKTPTVTASLKVCFWWHSVNAGGRIEPACRMSKHQMVKDSCQSEPQVVHSELKDVRVPRDNATVSGVTITFLEDGGLNDLYLSIDLDNFSENTDEANGIDSDTIL